MAIKFKCSSKPTAIKFKCSSKPTAIKFKCSSEPTEPPKPATLVADQFASLVAKSLFLRNNINKKKNGNKKTEMPKLVKNLKVKDDCLCGRFSRRGLSSTNKMVARLSQGIKTDPTLRIDLRTTNKLSRFSPTAASN